VGGQTSGTAPAKNPGATFYIPTEDQWYKAAYYKGGGTNAGYWDYATQSNSAPTAVTSGSTGIGSAGSTGNFANYNNTAVWNSQSGNVTTVGTNGGASVYGAFDMSGNLSEWNDLTGSAGAFTNSASFYGTFDQSGNVYQWNDYDGLAPSGSSRGLRGGSWGGSAFSVSSSGRSAIGPSIENNDVGFRLASPVAVPEPSTWVMGLAGIACAGWGAYRRRRAR
jgi:formylglycine-generating enzyme required for sulfatase activity